MFSCLFHFACTNLRQDGWMDYREAKECLDSKHGSCSRRLSPRKNAVALAASDLVTYQGLDPTPQTIPTF